MPSRDLSFFPQKCTFLFFHIVPFSPISFTPNKILTALPVTTYTISMLLKAVIVLYNIIKTTSSNKILKTALLPLEFPIMHTVYYLVKYINAYTLNRFFIEE